MVTERKVLRTYAYAYIQGDDAQGEQKRSVERWVQVYSCKLEGWFIDPHTRRNQLRLLLEELTRGTCTIDYVLVHSPERISKRPPTVRQIQQQCRAAGAQVVYTSRV